MGKSSPPAAPDYGPLIASEQATSASDAAAAQVQAQVAEDQLAQQGVYAQKSADVAQQYEDMAKQQQDWGEQQYNQLQPYLTNYLQEQLGFQDAATSNEKAQTAAALQSTQEAQDTYNRYMANFAPVEDQFAQQAKDFASPAREDQAAAAARGDVATQFQASADAAKRQLQSYGIDPTQGRYQGTTTAMNIAKAASQAAAGTMARQQTEAQGNQMELAAIEAGQKLPAQAIGEATLGMQQSSAGLAGANVGGGGLAAGGNLLNAGTNAMGSPTSYAALSNPYTSMMGSYGTEGVGMYGASNMALGNAGSALAYGGNMMNQGYQDALSSYEASAASSPWSAIGKVAGMGLSFLGSPSSGTMFTKLFGG